MKSQHRHDLKTNELAEWLANFPNWFKENLKTIVYGSVGIVIIAGAGGYFWYTRNIQTAEQRTEFTVLISAVPEQKRRIVNDQMRGGDASFALLQTANQLELVAENTNQDGLAAMAELKAAELLRAELLYRPRPLSPADKRRQLNTARRHYNAAIELSESISSLKASARFGLGLCEEELGNFDKARTIYTEIINTEEFEGTTAAYQAKQRLTEMNHYQKRVVFQPRPEVPSPAVPEVTAPDIANPQLDIEFPPMNPSGQ